jgi:hypothetical protein
MRKIIYPPFNSHKKIHIYWEGGIEMAPRKGSRKMSKSLSVFSFYFLKEVQLYSNDFERVGYSNALHVWNHITCT